MKTGPALKQLTSYRSIHDAGQARALTEEVMQLFENNETKECLDTAKALLEHWEQKINAHDDA